MIDPTIRATILEKVQSAMTNKRFEHVLRVEQKALELAHLHQIDETKCQYAALLHDYAKEWSMAEYENIVNQFNLEKEMLLYGSMILHGPVAAAILPSVFGITDTDIIQAIQYHTTGHSVMNEIAQVLFIADYIEDGRTFNGVQKARLLASDNLQSAIAYKLQQTIQFLAEKQEKIYPDTIIAYNAWQKHLPSAKD